MRKLTSSIYAGFSALMLVLVACSHPADKGETGIVDGLFSQLEGTWKMGEGPVRESWSRVGEDYVARVYSVDGDDTITTETIVLEQLDGEVFYRATVAGQNQGETISFRMVERDTAKVVFENPDHDFPTSITYQFISEDSITAVISGLVDGQKRKVEFPYIRQ